MTKDFFLSDESKRLISIANTGRKHTADTKALMSIQRMGRRYSDETNEKRASHHRGMKRSDETRKNISMSKIGKKQSPEQIYNNAQARIGHKQSQETIEKRKVACIGKQNKTQKQKDAASEAQRGKPIYKNRKFNEEQSAIIRKEYELEPNVRKLGKKYGVNDDAIKTALGTRKARPRRIK